MTLPNDSAIIFNLFLNGYTARCVFQYLLCCPHLDAQLSQAIKIMNNTIAIA
jgi:hypothetical protein